MATTELRPVEGRDALVRGSRGLFLFGLLTLPMLALRVAGTVTISDVAFAVSAALLILSVDRPRAVGVPPFVVLAAYLVWLGGLLASFRADSIFGSVAVAARLVFILVALTWLARSHLRDEAAVRAAAGWWIAGVAAFALASLYQTKHTGFLATDSTSGRLAGLAQHVSDAGGILAIAFVFVLADTVTGARSLRKLALLALIGVGLILSGSVSGFLSVGVGVIVIAVRMRVRLRIILLGGAAAWLALQVGQHLQASKLSPFQRFVATTSGRYDTLDSRLATDRYAWEHIIRQPVVGRGLDAASGVTGVQGLGVHNMLLLAWWQGGILVLAGVLAGLMAAVRIAWSAPATRLKEQLSATLVTAFAFAMTSPELFDRYTWLPAILLYAVWRAPAGAVSGRGASPSSGDLTRVEGAT